MSSGIDLLWLAQNDYSRSMPTDRIHALPQFNCMAVTIPITGKKAFIFEFASTIETSASLASKFKGIEIQILQPADITVKWLTIYLLEEKLFDPFCYLIEDIIAELMPLISEKDALNAIFKTIGLWKRFFEKINPGGLSIEQQKGLYGELLIIRELMNNNIQAETVLLSWEGPNGKNQDFIYPNVSIEIKTTTANHPVIRITSENQLDFQGNLTLVHVILNERKGPVNNLVSLINEIKEIFSTVSVDCVSLFERKLLLVGYAPSDAELYLNNGYDLRNIVAYDVRQGFPRITTSDSMPGVFSITYSIETSACIPYIVDFPNYILEKINNGNTE